ncbi:MAG TPA: hypothetical protein VF622_13030 [Segetibacter sp.]|jgi:hypothetical protein
MQQEEKKQIGTTNDLSKDMIFEGDEYKNKESHSHSSASEGTLKKLDENQQQADREEVFKGNEEDSLDNAVGQKEQFENADGTKRTTLEEDEKPKLDADDITS